MCCIVKLGAKVESLADCSLADIDIHFSHSKKTISPQRVPRAQRPSSKGVSGINGRPPKAGCAVINNGSSAASKGATSKAVANENAGKRRGCSPLGSSPACPGIFSSPKPEELPRPSFKLFKIASISSVLHTGMSCSPRCVISALSPVSVTAA